MAALSTRKEAPDEFKFKPDNGLSSYIANCRFSNYFSPVFFDENNTVKLGDFGLSKALAPMLGYVSAMV